MHNLPQKRRAPDRQIVNRKQIKIEVNPPHPSKPRTFDSIVEVVQEYGELCDINTKQLSRYTKKRSWSHNRYTFTRVNG
jgi:hypothetical protein